MDVEADAMVEKKPDPAFLESVATSSLSSRPGAASDRASTSPPTSREPPFISSIKASGVSPPVTALSLTPFAISISGSSGSSGLSGLSGSSGSSGLFGSSGSSTTRSRSASMSAPVPVSFPPPARRRPLPGSAPTHQESGLSSNRPSSSRQPSRDVSMSVPSSAITTQEKMLDPEKEGREETDAKSPSIPLPARHGSIAVHTASSASSPSMPTNALEDEIIVGTETNGMVPSPALAVSDHDDVDMEDVRDQSPVPPYPKRKRSSIYRELNEDSMEQQSFVDSVDGEDSLSSRYASKQAIQATVTTQRSITIGYWRDSAIPDVTDKHAVVGFIDTRDRLRTRVQQSSRSGKFVAADYPLPPGPGGSWVTFERVVFEKHLVGLNHNEVKEYVKIRSENPVPYDSPDKEAAGERAAVKEAVRRAAMHPTPDNMPPPAIAYGVDLPDFIANAARPEKKRRMAPNGTFGAIAPASDVSSANTPSHQTLAPAGGSASVVSAIQRSAIDLLPGTRPTKILLGFWRGSSEERPEDKHAVFGILGANDMFRVKVTRETRDGRAVMGNFPTGAGALWIHYDEVEFEKHIRHLSRPEVKEYVRVRQRQIDEGERPEQRIENETKAVFDAQARVISAGGVSQSTLGTAGRVDTISFASAANLNSRHAESGSGGMGGEMLSHGYPHDMRSMRDYEPRQTRRSFAADPRDGPTSLAAAAMAAVTPGMRPSRHSLPEAASMAGRPMSNEIARPLPNNSSGNSHIADRIERTNNLARREITRVESMQMRNEQRAASRDSGGMMVGGGPGGSSMQQSNGGRHGALSSYSMNGNGNGPNGYGMNNGTTNGANNGVNSRMAFNENIGRLNKVWASQEASRLRSAGGGEDAKIFMGVKYERKQTGPFQGKLVSPGTILSIDGEDYVEYRVLTKPTFF